MEHSEIISEVLSKNFPEECSIAGSENLQKICEGTTEVVRTFGGRNFEIGPILQWIIVAAGFLSNVVTVWAFLKASKKIKQEQTHELHIHIEEIKKLEIRLDDPAKDLLVAGLLKLLEERDKQE